MEKKENNWKGEEERKERVIRGGRIPSPKITKESGLNDMLATSEWGRKKKALRQPRGELERERTT